MESILGYVAVFFARVADMTLATIRTLMVMRGRKLMAAVIGFAEVLIYVVALKFVLETLNDIPSLIFYALGFAAGNAAGLWAEERLALGYYVMQVITGRDAVAFAAGLRERGFGVTIFPCQGREACYDLLSVVFERRRLNELEDAVRDWDPKAFVTVTDTRTIRGGHFYRNK
ncbi:DUF2179 domain-containing protein [Anaeroselena agilis]|uniref:UPF0316 protein Q4T40_14400 n=1 Tax=Anaeroselena agilis TaxID=3063788 RepID=A0ABU3P079_9FIRM|nr:DUF5698 domain-containing protein [Selenomonadales bacterium 4137-cl]